MSPFSCPATIEVDRVNSPSSSCIVVCWGGVPDSGSSIINTGVSDAVIWDDDQPSMLRRQI